MKYEYTVSMPAPPAQSYFLHLRPFKISNRENNVGISLQSVTLRLDNMVVASLTRFHSVGEY